MDDLGLKYLVNRVSQMHQTATRDFRDGKKFKSNQDYKKLKQTKKDK